MAPASQALNAILPLIATAPYEAHQKARTFASRYLKAASAPTAKSKDGFDTAIEVLFQSARELFKVGQLGSGTDLSVYLLEAYEKKGEELNDVSRGRLTQLIALAGPTGAWRKTIIDKAIAWSAKQGPCPSGDPDLHHYVGEILYKDGAFDVAEQHLLSSPKRDSARLLAQMHFEWSQLGTEPGPGAYASRAVLPLLLTGQIVGARTYLDQFLSRLKAAQSSLESVPLSSPNGDQDEIWVTADHTLNFLQLAVVTCQRSKGTAESERQARDTWIRLVVFYQKKGGLNATDKFKEAVSSLSQVYFGIQPRQQAANPLQSMMASLFGGAGPGGAPGGGLRGLGM